MKPDIGKAQDKIQMRDDTNKKTALFHRTMQITLQIQMKQFFSLCATLTSYLSLFRSVPPNAVERYGFAVYF